MTAEELCALPERERIDQRLVRGRLVERPHAFHSPAHGSVIANLCGLFGNWVRRTSPAEWVAYGYGCPYRLQRTPDTLLCFDMSVISTQLNASIDSTTPFIDGLPALAIDVIDLDDAGDKVSELVDVSLTCGVPQLWIIDPFAGWIDVYRPSGEKQSYTAADEVRTGPELPGFSCRVVQIFE